MFVGKQRKQLLHTVCVDKAEIGDEDTDEHRKQVPSLQVRANLGHDVSDRHVEEGTRGEGEADGQESAVQLHAPQAEHRHDERSKRRGSGENENVLGSYT